MGDAGRIVQIACEKAEGIGVPMAITIVEPTGDLVHFVKMDGAPYSAIHLAQQKAIAAARYRRPTQAFYDQLEGGHAFFLTFPGICAVPGGVLLIEGGMLVGAIGVSGGNAHQDLLVAEAAVSALLQQ